ncbi:MAG: AMP-binding protein [Nocardioidaceae bacterium]
MAILDLAELVAAAAARGPERPAIIEVPGVEVPGRGTPGPAVDAAGGRRRSWGELDAEIGAVAGGLARLGVVAPQRVMLSVGNRIELVTTYLGTLRAQAVAVPVNPAASVADLARMVADSGARVVVADAQSLDRVRSAVADLTPAPRIVTVGVEAAAGETPYDDLVAGPPAPLPPLPDPEKLAALLYTSGASGVPRAAMLTHRALLANLEQMAAVEPAMVQPDDVVLGVLPLFHVYGLNAVLGCVLHAGATLVLSEGFDPEGSLDLVADHGCTVVPAAPAVFGHWLGRERLRERLATVRVMLSGSAPLDADVIAAFEGRSGVPVHQGYGLTEAAPVVTSTLCSGRPVPGSLGAPLPGVEVRIVDEDGRVEEEDPGQVQIRGANLFSGYWPGGSDGPGEDGWWSTGDLGYRDDQGDLRLVDRLGDLLVVSGFNVYPREVEDVIRDLPGVTGVAVIGVDDPQDGTVVVAYVVAPDLADAAEVVAARCAERLVAFKRPGRVEVVDRLPVTSTGKVEKGRLRLLERRRTWGVVE